MTTTDYVAKCTLKLYSQRIQDGISEPHEIIQQLEIPERDRA